MLEDRPMRSMPLLRREEVRRESVEVESEGAEAGLAMVRGERFWLFQRRRSAFWDRVDEVLGESRCWKEVVES